MESKKTPSGDRRHGLVSFGPRQAVQANELLLEFLRGVFLGHVIARLAVRGSTEARKGEHVARQVVARGAPGPRQTRRPLSPQMPSAASSASRRSSCRGSGARPVASAHVGVVALGPRRLKPGPGRWGWVHRPAPWSSASRRVRWTSSTSRPCRRAVFWNPLGEQGAIGVQIDQHVDVVGARAPGMPQQHAANAEQPQAKQQDDHAKKPARQAPSSLPARTR